MTIARPRGFGSEVRVPQAVLDAAEAFRAGKITGAEARSRIAGHKTDLSGLDEREKALAEARKRIAKALLDPPKS